MRKLILLLSAFAGSILYTNAQWTQTTVSQADVTCFSSFGTNEFAGTFSNGIYVSSDNGVSWSNVGKGMTDSTRTNVRGLGAIGTKVFAGTLSGLYVSADTGKIWVPVTDSVIAGNYVQAFAVMGTNLFAGTGGGGMFLSEDSGKSWMAIDSGLTDLFENALAVSGSNIFAGTYNGIFLSSDTGKTWSAINTGLTNNQVNALTAIGTNVFAGTNGGIFLTGNIGTSWSAVNSGSIAALGLAASGSNVFAATDGSGMLASNYTWSSWTEENTGLTDLNLSTIIVDGNYIYAGTYGFGIWKRSLSDIILATDYIMPDTGNISIYPNPAVNELRIKNRELRMENTTICIKNMLGQTVSQSQILNPQCQVDISNLQAGMYFLQVKSDSGSDVGTFVKE